jgi:hypothetical protein
MIFNNYAKVTDYWSESEFQPKPLKLSLFWRIIYGIW